MYNAGVMENAHLLRLMGIDVWRARAPRARNPAGATTTDRSSAGAAAAESPAAGDIPGAGTRPAPEAEAAVQPKVPQPPTSRPQIDLPRRSPPPVDAVAPFSVVCLSDGAALLLAEAPEQRFPLRFCTDLLRALGASGSPRQVVFSWPQPGLEPGTGHAGRSLAAFIDKQLGDSGAARLLVCSRMCERVPDLQWPDRALVMPSLDRLLLEADLKRALWLQIRKVATEGIRASRSSS